MPHEQMCLDLFHRIKCNTYNNQQACSTKEEDLLGNSGHCSNKERQDSNH